MGINWFHPALVLFEDLDSANNVILLDPVLWSALHMLHADNVGNHDHDMDKMETSNRNRRPSSMNYIYNLQRMQLLVPFPPCSNRHNHRTNNQRNPHRIRPNPKLIDNILDWCWESKMCVVLTQYTSKNQNIVALPTRDPDQSNAGSRCVVRRCTMELLVPRARTDLTKNVGVSTDEIMKSDLIE